MSGARRSLVAAFVACAALAGCESVPSTRFTVREADGLSPIENAVVLLRAGHPATEPAEMAARLRTDPTVTNRMHPPMGHEGDGWFAMRTGSDGTAEYSELRLWRWFTEPPPARREFFVWADGHASRWFAVDVGIEHVEVAVPLARSAEP